MIPVVATNSGLVAYDIGLLGNVVSKGSISITVYEDADCKKLLKKKKTYQFNVGTKKRVTDSIYLKRKQNCYLKLTISKELMVDKEKYDFYLRLQEYSSENRTLKNKETVFSYQNGKGTSVFYKVNVKKTGILTVDTGYDSTSYGTPRITLCNSKKKGISESCGIYITNSQNVKKKKATPEGENIFAVSKGTYYLKLSDVKGTYKIRSAFSTITENSGKAKAKAKKLTIGGKWVKGVILPEDKKNKYDWYKFTLEESKRVRINFRGSTSGKEKLQLEVIPHSGAEFTQRALLSFSGIEQNGSGKSGSEWPEGTYYLRINKTTAKGTGTYRLQIKTY